jgi:uracil-DNA glycosylase
MASSRRPLTAEHFRKSNRRIDAEIVSGAGLAQVAVDNERAHAFSLGQQPGEIERRQRLAFGDTRAGDDNRAHLHALAGLQDSRAQRAKLFTVSRARLADSNKMRLDARGEMS